jgi:hypothetical protein
LNLKKILSSISTAGALAALGAVAAFAATTIVVTPANTQGWSTADTRPGGAVNFVLDSTAPAGKGALELTTDATTTAKAQYLHAANTPLASVTAADYYTKQVSASFPEGDPSYQLVMYLNGGTSGFTTLVFEPYQNPTQGAVVNNVWQKWDVANGLFWSTRNVTCSNGAVVGSPGGPAIYTLAQIKSMCPAALVAGYGVNIGSNNPAYVVRTDLFNFNGTIYDFEVTNVPTNKNQCKNGGFANFTDANSNAFKNQGQCVRFVEEHQNDDRGQQGQNDDNGRGD